MYKYKELEITSPLTPLLKARGIRSQRFVELFKATNFEFTL
jgi:hypothetical protein